ncbi:MAG: hypothetical protein PHY70_00295 [Methanocellales archaeon]|nr:hypothetical protein [Methanocellales archaeon]
MGASVEAESKRFRLCLLARYGVVKYGGSFEAVSIILGVEDE